jgi:hypothetical protein
MADGFSSRILGTSMDVESAWRDSVKLPQVVASSRSLTLQAILLVSAVANSGVLVWDMSTDRIHEVHQKVVVLCEKARLRECQRS